MTCEYSLDFSIANWQTVNSYPYLQAIPKSRFIVVRFLADGFYDVIPSSWICGLNSCLWPPKHIKKREAARNSIEPSEDWIEYDVEMLAYKGK